jgi:hypothetical protein
MSGRIGEIVIILILLLMPVILIVWGKLGEKKRGNATTSKREDEAEKE